MLGPATVFCGKYLSNGVSCGRLWRPSRESPGADCGRDGPASFSAAPACSRLVGHSDGPSDGAPTRRRRTSAFDSGRSGYCIWSFRPTARGMFASDMFGTRSSRWLMSVGTATLNLVGSYMGACCQEVSLLHREEKMECRLLVVMIGDVRHGYEFNI